MEENIIEFDGAEVDLSNLSDEELISLYQDIKKEESSLKMIIKEYLIKYPFLKNIEKE